MRSLVLLAVVILSAVCFGRIAKKLGRNPILFGIGFVVPGVNLIVLAVLAFGREPRVVELDRSDVA